MSQTILVTGNKGRVGCVVEKKLKAHGYAVMGYDVLDGKDILNFDLLRERMKGKRPKHTRSIQNRQA